VWEKKMKSNVNHGKKRTRGWMTALVICCVAAPYATSFAAEMTHDHSNHAHPAPDAPVKRSVVEVKVAPTPMVRQDGTATTFARELEGSKPTIVAFIYTSCTTVCPVTSQILSKTQDLLGKDLAGSRILSVSIDPEYDTAERLLAYGKKYDALPQWQHYSGTQANSVTIQKAFSAYRGDKMNHIPLIFIQGGSGKPWVRLEGFPSAEQVVQELRAQTRG
jgi:protein SCO1/2